MGGVSSSSSSKTHYKRRSTPSLGTGRPRFSTSSEKTCVPESKSRPRESEAPQSNRSPVYSGIDHVSADATSAYTEFLLNFPEYKLTWTLDALRRTDYSRPIDSGETYADYMGGAIYPESLPDSRGFKFDTSHSLRLSAICADEARAAVLAFFRAPPDEYTVIFTPNASGALKLVGESYPLTNESRYTLARDSHNSAHETRKFAAHRDARVCYIPSTPTGGLNVTTAHRLVFRHQPNSTDAAPCLFVMTAQSNITNAKSPLSIMQYAAALGYHTVLDAAALAPTSDISITDYLVDAMAVSFYKMFGFPTGVGALIAKKSFWRHLQRPWFAGGNVDVVQVPGKILTLSSEPHEQFEARDGTLNYLSLLAVTDGLRFLSAYMPFMPLRLSCLLHYLVASLSELRHDTTGKPVVRILSAVPARRLKTVDAQSDVGSLLSLIFLTPSGEILPNSFIAHAASRMGISLRIGCMCNPGGAAALLGLEGAMEQLYRGVTFADFERALGRELGVVRLSLGLASNFQDVWNVLRFARVIAQEEGRMAMWAGWVAMNG
ncbi:methyltransferase type 11 [Mycena albidolilacea]|uniref:Methyltransferase type 11 n=1 Tax=Mycena albidolilacea TaxID=1033008 RepID=A0AAD7AH09_9AGAR|nr:methyltransferase type 11 [Mycena albidolilacea]